MSIKLTATLRKGNCFLRKICVSALVSASSRLSSHFDLAVKVISFCQIVSHESSIEVKKRNKERRRKYVIAPSVNGVLISNNGFVYNILVERLFRSAQ